MASIFFKTLISAPEDGDPDLTAYGFQSQCENREIAVEDSLRWQPDGISSTALKASIKYDNVYDLAIVKLDHPGPAAGVFTRNRSASPAVHIDREHLVDGVAQALIVISKNANVFTPTDREDAEAICRMVSEVLDVAEQNVIISCTGVIGVPLPMAKINAALAGVPGELAAGVRDEVASAILTTDKGPKVCSVAFGQGRLAGMAKGAGMIEPNMATMLVYFFTNLNIPGHHLSRILSEINERTFNSISVDTDTSTSDSVVIFSTGTVEPTDELVADFESALEACMTKLSRDVVYQAEGATKLVEANVSGALDAQHARQVAKLIINSPLIKTAVFGSDPNWGRIVMAIGKPGQPVEAPIDPKQLEISINGFKLFERGAAVPLELDALSNAMRVSKKISIDVTLGDGAGAWSAWGCDLSYDYVKTNAEYTS